MATSKRVGYAVVGLGGISERAVLPAFRRTKRARLVAVVSGDEPKARKMAQKFGATDYYTYDDYALCLSHPEVKAVFVALPNGLHADYTVRAAAAGKHVLCEKPMANSVEECRRMIHACRDNSVKLMIAYRKYLEPANRELKKLIASGKLGRLKLMHASFSINFPPTKARHWHMDRKLAGGGALVDIGIYCLNEACWLSGQEPTEVQAFAWNLDPVRYDQVEENIVFRLNFPGTWVLQGSASFGAAQSTFVHVQGERGWAQLNPSFTYTEAPCLFGNIGGKPLEKSYRKVDEFALELDYFADCIRKNRNPEPSGEEGLRDVAIMQALYQSARENRPVPV